MVCMCICFSSKINWVILTRYGRGGSLILFDENHERKRFADLYLYVIVFTIGSDRVLISL